MHIPKLLAILKPSVLKLFVQAVIRKWTLLHLFIHRWYTKHSSILKCLSEKYHFYVMQCNHCKSLRNLQSLDEKQLKSDHLL